MTTQNDLSPQDQDRTIEKLKTRIAIGVAVTAAFFTLFVYAGLVFAMSLSSATIMITSLAAMLLFVACEVTSAVITTILGLAYLELLMRRYRPIVLDRRDVLTRQRD